jgi:acyl carrier protein
MTEIEEKIVKIITSEMRLDEPVALTDNLSDLNADSLDRAEIIFSIEDEFGIELNIPNRETAMSIFVTVQSVADYVKDVLQKQSTV